MTSNLLTLNDVALLLKVSTRQLRRWRSLGLLEFTYLGGSQRYPRIQQRHLDAFLLASKQGTKHKRK